MGTKYNKLSPLSYALRLIKIRMRSEAELKNKLTLKGYSSAEISKTISDLKKAKLIDDEKFAEIWLRSQSIIKPSGKKLLILKMKRFGLSQEIIDNAFKLNNEEFDEFSQAKRILNGKLNYFSKYEGQEKKEKMLTLLLRRGFDYQIAKKAIEVRG